MTTNFSGPVVSDNGFTGDIAGNVTGDVTGDVTGNVTGNVTGDVTGNLTGLTFGGTPEEINSDGSLSVSMLLSIIGPDGTDGSTATAFTLPDGTAGQVKLLKYNDGSWITDAVVTPANLEGYSTLTFNAKTESAILVFDGSSWIPVYSSATLG
jgi:hypothetical protein